jgi:hypothetical protein
MNYDKFPELENRASSELTNKFLAMKEHAEHVISEKVKEMKAEGLAHELSDDEESMLLAYKRFYVKSKPGSVFQWRTPRVQQGIVTPAEPSLLGHPPEV